MTTHLAAFAERLWELPLRAMPPHRAAPSTWPLPSPERARIRLRWPVTLEWKPGGHIVETIVRGMGEYVPLERADIPQPYEGVILFEAIVDGERHVIVLDYLDRPERIGTDALRQSSVYFKLQFQAGGYDDDRIIRGGFTAGVLDYYRYLPWLRRKATAERGVDVLARFGFRFQAELRRRALRELIALPSVRVAGGDGRKVRYSRFLREAADAKIAIDLPGNGPFCHRLPEFLGLGAMVIGVRHPAELPEPLTAGVHYVAVAPDLHDLADACRYYLARPAERQAIAANGQSYFDRYLHYNQLAAYYLNEILARCGRSRTA